MASALTSRRGATLWLGALLLLTLDCKRAIQSYPNAVGGVGVVVQTTGNGHAIARVVSGGPAAGAGLQVGDRILAVNGESTEGKPLASI
ncbi:MAG: PDZ domain-containing protein, partial [Gemmatimonadales bacterium]